MILLPGAWKASHLVHDHNQQCLKACDDTLHPKLSESEAAYSLGSSIHSRAV